ncbi:transcriptional regulator SplA domain-containing protein [Evansella sp. AB-P1]|uniref:transcriptional regulator SplA domain-containing protein n=1 Tax=Evansella sp. AB-P1 TaxID=3037653 RepID=UPI00241C22F7|nr:transcriptional regulator SplA domain-containing protein [Evansella sp. AB-P1]MDG5786343.1 transcriptional regulator SplA domain-containing protein [Evansella sp. AB-P1]
MDITQLHSGDSVFVICRNPHTQTVAEIQEASVVEHPDHPGRTVLFLFEDYIPLTDDYALFSSYQEAEEMYNMYFNETEIDMY